MSRESTDLSGLEHCINLAEVSLAKNEIENVAPLTSSPNIQLLDLSYNRVKDIGPLEKTSETSIPAVGT